MTDEEREIFIDRVKNLCLQYDKINDSYPEHRWEGRSFYFFVKRRLDPNADIEVNEEEWLKEAGIE